MPIQALRILRISRVVADRDRAAAFYCDRLGFEPVAQGRADPGTLTALGLDGVHAEETVLRLGAEEIGLVSFASPGRPYPPDSRSDDTWFQHLAIVVSDMDAAYRRLSAGAAWRPITNGGPQTLPPSNGGVRAFKFRDPDHHPLELIWFPPGQGRPVWREPAPAGPFLGIDHSALSVASGADSLAFYRALGFQVSSRSANQGPAQSALDGLPGARAQVTGLRPASADGPGLELLAYDPPGRSGYPAAANDIVTDWVTVEVAPSPGDGPKVVRDPDGHILALVGPLDPPAVDHPAE